MLICVNYHYIRNSFDAKYPSIFGLKPKKFESQLERLSKLGKFISSDDVVSKISDDRPLKNINFLITFDDGLKEQYDLALPILERMGIPAIFFANSLNSEKKFVSRVHKIHLIRSVVDPKFLIKRSLSIASDLSDDISIISKKAISHYKYDNSENATLKYLLNFILTDSNLEFLVDKTFNEYFDEKSVNNSLYMDDHQLINLAKRQMLGSHGKSHIPIGLQDELIRVDEITDSHRYFQNLTGYNLAAFSFPYGSYESCLGCKNILKESGFKFSLTMERSINHDLKQPLGLSRFDNNDMPGGKSYKYKSDVELLKYPKRNWKILN